MMSIFPRVVVRTPGAVTALVLLGFALGVAHLPAQGPPAAGPTRT